MFHLNRVEKQAIHQLIQVDVHIYTHKSVGNMMYNTNAQCLVKMAGNEFNLFLFNQQQQSHIYNLVFSLLNAFANLLTVTDGSHNTFSL